MQKSLASFTSSAALCAWLVGLWFLAAAPASAVADNVTGRITGPNRKPVAAAMVTIVREDGLYSETAYSGPDGQYQLSTSISGASRLRVRSPGFQDAIRSLDVVSSRLAPQNVQLIALQSAEEMSDSLTASSHFPRLSMLPSEQAQKLFRNDCTGCHQVGNQFTRRPRTPEGWQTILELMLSNWEVEPAYKKELAGSYAQMLRASFDGKPVRKHEVHAYDPKLKHVRVREWKLPEGVLPHDAESYTRDGRIFVADSGNDRIYIVDPKTNLIQTVHLPALNSPAGGRLASSGTLGPSLIANSSHAPHSLQESTNAKYYVTACFANQVGEFDPTTFEYKGFDVPGGLCPHTARFDRLDHFWFTVAISNQIGRFDPKSHEMTMIALPDHSNRPHFPRPFPYGIDVNPIDGSIWYASLTAHKIGRIDAQTLAIREFDSPYVGPRRLRFAADGTLWIPEFGEGAIARLDTRTMKYKLYKIPTLTPDGVESPYALAVHPQTQDVWITANMSDRVFRFIPGEERFIAYPMPTRGTYMRDIIFPKSGGVCSTSGPPLPAAMIEGGMPTLVCIDDNESTSSQRSGR
jgi:streptogramin lyase